MSKLPELKPVENSSNIKAMHHEGDKLYVRFASGGAVYQYSGVPADLHKELLEAKSPGSVFHGKIKGKFEFTKHDPEK